MKLKELIERIKLVSIETSEGRAADSTYLSPEALAELMLPRVFKIVTDEAMATPFGVNMFRKDHSLDLASGWAVLPPEVPDSYAEAFEIRSTSAASLASLETDYFSWQADDNTLVPKFYLENRRLYYRGAGLSLASAATDTSIITLSAPTIPKFPTYDDFAIDSLIQLNPVRLETKTHGFSTGDRVRIYGTSGPFPSINGVWTVTVVSTTQFDVDGTTGVTGTLPQTGRIRYYPDFDTTELDIPDFIIEKIILLTAGIVKGEISPTRIGLDPKMGELTPFNIK